MIKVSEVLGLNAPAGSMTPSGPAGYTTSRASITAACWRLWGSRWPAGRGSLQPSSHPWPRPTSTSGGLRAIMLQTHDACPIAAGLKLGMCQACVAMSVCAEDELTVNCNNLMRLASADTNSSDATAADSAFVLFQPHLCLWCHHSSSLDLCCTCHMRSLSVSPSSG